MAWRGFGCNGGFVIGVAGTCYYRLCKTRFGHATVRSVTGGLRRFGILSDFHLPFDALSLDHEPVEALMDLWSRIHWSSGDGMMPAEQLLAIYRLAVGSAVDGDIVELGSWRGLTTSYLATAAGIRERCHVYAVDTFRGTKEGASSYTSVEKHGGETLTEFRRTLRRAGVSDGVTPLIGLTTEMAPLYPGCKASVILVDADHSFEGVRADFESWWDHLADGGLMIFHDHLMPDVARCIDEVVLHHPQVVAAPGLVVDNVYVVSKRAGAAVPDRAVPMVGAAC
ncbi:MAG: class I SAM-dependent methyltransferase [Planctomycetota bacterium]|jgi:predicted O-methyltransferase YrrM